MRIRVGDYIRTGQLTLVQTQTFLKDIRVFMQLFEDANAPDFKQWLFNEPGSPYENNGFEQQTYYIAQLRDELLAIYNGNY